MPKPKRENAPAGQGLGREKEAEEVGNLKAEHDTLVAQADLSASNVPLLFTRQAKRQAARYSLIAWVGALRANQRRAAVIDCLGGR